jgi:biotin-dependent carboxylase-like uncharacterized protein
MEPALRVLSPGLLTTVQDCGRVGYQHLGVAAGGALDPLSLAAANALVGNDASAGALEVAYMGPALKVEAESVRLAFAGADAAIEILPHETAASGSGSRIGSMRTVRLRRGEVVRIGALANAAVLYVAVEGGLRIEPALGSVSTYIRGGIGGLAGRALAAGDRLPLNRDAASERGEAVLRGLDLAPPARFRVILGPQADYFTADAIRRFLESDYTLAGADRMAMRLAGPRLEHARGFNIVSDGIAAGSVQVPGSGQPIVLLADRQTTGGYPKIATVISADLPALGRLPIGRTIAFEQVSLAAAHDLRRRLLDEIATIADRIEPLGHESADITAHLLGHNLISGVVDAHHWT